MKKPQWKRILEHIDKHGKTTIGGIQRDLKINGATARISDLRKMGYSIISIREEGDSYNTYYRGADQFNKVEEPIEYTREDYEADEFDRMWHSGDFVRG